MKLLVLLLIGLVAVEAIFRTNYYGGKRPDDCDDGPTKRPTKRTTTTTTTTVKPTTPTTTTTTVKPTTTTRKPEYRCPANWTTYHRTPSEYNRHTGLWCMQVFPTVDQVSVQYASLMCMREGSQLSNFENAEERIAITAEAQKHILSTGRERGSIAIGGVRVKECQSMNLTLLEYPPCNDKTTLFYLPDEHTNPEYTWTTFAEGEPNSKTWTYEIEQCLQLHVEPGKPEQHGLINDIFCAYAIPPTTPNHDLYRNFGALCGRMPNLVRDD